MDVIAADRNSWNDTQVLFDGPKVTGCTDVCQSTSTASRLEIPAQSARLSRTVSQRHEEAPARIPFIGGLPFLKPKILFDKALRIIQGVAHFFEDLQPDRVQPRVMSFVDNAHASADELLDNAVVRNESPDERGGCH